MHFSLDAFVFNEHTQVGFKIHQEQNKHYFSSRRVNQPSIIAITIATVCCQGLLPLNSFPSINSKSNPLAATNVCFFISIHPPICQNGLSDSTVMHSLKNEKQ